MLGRFLRRALDAYLAASLAWAVNWAARRDRKGCLALLNAWAFWLLSPALLLGTLRLWGLGTRANGQPRAAAAPEEGSPGAAGASLARFLAAGWLLGGTALLVSRYQWLAHSAGSAVFGYARALPLGTSAPRPAAPRPDQPGPSGSGASSLAPDLQAVPVAARAGSPGAPGGDGALGRLGGSPALAGLAYATPRALDDVATGPGAEARRLRLLSFNVLMENNRAAAILGLLRREKADVVLLQELEPAMYRFLDAGLQDVYAYRHLQRHRRRGGSLGFFSCMPFEITGLWRSRPMAPYAVRATLELPQGPVDLYNVHLLSVGVRAMLGTGLNGNFRLREAQAATLAQEIEARELPALALGDFNMTEGNEAYAVAHRRLADAWLLAGRGPGWTWPRRLGLVHKGRHSLRPVLRLDYCFCSPGVDPRDARVLLDDTGSDHCPILVEAVVS